MNIFLKLLLAIPGILLFLGIGFTPVLKNSLGSAIILLLLFTGVSLLFFCLARKKSTLTSVNQGPFLVFAMGCGLYFLSCLASFMAKEAHLRELHNLDLPIRFLLIPLIGWLLFRYSRYHAIKTHWFNYSFLVAAFMALGITTYQRYILNHPTAFGALNHHIIFGGLSALLAVTCLGLQFKWTWLSYVGFFVGATASFLSTSRGAWPALLLIMVLHPFFIYRFSSNYPSSKLKLVGLPLAGFVLITMLVLTPSTDVMSRLALAVDDVEKYFIEDTHLTSIGFRFEMWKASWIMYKEHWALGVGIGDYNTAFQQLVSEGQVRGIENNFIPHAHNDLLHVMATIGTFGAIGYLLILLIPSIYFFKQIIRSDRLLPHASKNHKKHFIGLNLAGLYTTLTFGVAGLTEALLTRNVSVNYYLFIVTLFYTFIAQIEQSSACRQRLD